MPHGLPSPGTVWAHGDALRRRPLQWRLSPAASACVAVAVWCLGTCVILESAFGWVPWTRWAGGFS